MTSPYVLAASASTSASTADTCKSSACECGAANSQTARTRPMCRCTAMGLAQRVPLLDDRDRLDLDQKLRLSQTLNDDQRVGRVGWRREHFVACLTDQGPIAPVGDERGGLQNVARRGAEVGQDGREVAPALARLLARVVDADDAPFGVERKLTGDVQRVATARDVRIVRLR